MDPVKIGSVRLYTYSLELVRPLSIGGVRLTHRKGMIIHLTSEDGIDGFGEIIPLEGRSRESLRQAQAQAKRLKPQLVGQSIPSGAACLDGKLQAWLEAFDLWPSVRFGIEMAVLHLIANTRNTPLFQPIPHNCHDYIRVHALLDGDRQEVVCQAQQLKAEGFADMKLKVNGSVQESADKVRAVNDILQGKALLHLDANQAWELEEAIRFGREIECSAVSYIEEPLKHVYNIPEFYQETLIPVALDESLSQLSFDEFKMMNGVDVVVLKPTVLGGIEKTWQMMQQATALGLNAVVSSSFESGLGLFTLGNLGGCAAHAYAVGLDTIKWFRQDLLKERLLIQHGKMDIRHRLIRHDDIDFSLLQEIR